MSCFQHMVYCHWRFTGTRGSPFPRYSDFRWSKCLYTLTQSLNQSETKMEHLVYTEDVCTCWNLTDFRSKVMIKLSDWYAFELVPDDVHLYRSIQASYRMYSHHHGLLVLIQLLLQGSSCFQFCFPQNHNMLDPHLILIRLHLQRIFRKATHTICREKRPWTFCRRTWTNNLMFIHLLRIQDILFHNVWSVVIFIEYIACRYNVL